MWGQIIGAIASSLLGNAMSNHNKPKAPEFIDYEEARKKANGRLSKDYQNTQQQMSNNVDQGSSHGYYGQAPSLYMKNRINNQLANSHNSDLARLASGIQNSTFQRDLQKYQQQLKEHNAGQSGLGGLFGGISSSILKDVDWSSIFGG